MLEIIKKNTSSELILLVMMRYFVQRKEQKFTVYIEIYLYKKCPQKVFDFLGALHRTPFLLMHQIYILLLLPSRRSRLLSFPLISVYARRLYDL